MKKVVLAVLLAVVATSTMASPKSKSYVVKLTGKTNISESGDTLSFQTNKGWKDVYYFGLDKKSEKALDNAIKKKSCVRITENKNDAEMHMGAVIAPAKCSAK